MDDQDRIATAHRNAQEYTELAAVFTKLEGAVFRELQQTPIGQDAKVKNLHLTLHNLAGIQQAMREMIDEGRMAEAAIAMAGLTRAA